jgi:signal transduction histidine kinase
MIRPRIPTAWATPKGHPPIANFLGVPFKQAGRTTGMIALANKASGYDRSDREAIEGLCTSLAMALAHQRAKRARERANRELEQRVAERTRDLEEFVYSVSHDLRAPLRAISGFAEIVARRHRADLNEEGRHYVDNVVEAAHRMGRLIDDLLRYSRLGRAAVRREDVPLAEVLEDVAENLAPRLASTGGRLDVPRDLPVVAGDRSLLMQVFGNLIENGLTYHARLAPPRVRVECRLEEADVVVRVEDEGIGIDLRYQDKVFSIFQRLHSDEEYPGTGVGLAIVKKAVGLLGGKVWVESERGKGSVFSVRLSRPTKRRERGDRHDQSGTHSSR